MMIFIIQARSLDNSAFVLALLSYFSQTVISEVTAFAQVRLQV
jgi:hypothetical protein